jgi:TM2 domain-containing membrane protein YozV
MNCALHPEVPAAAYCRTCGKPVCENCKRDVQGVMYCEACIAARLHGTPSGPAAGARAAVIMRAEGAPNPVIATLLGFIPGVGAIYNGQFIKAFIHVMIFAVLVWAGNQADAFGIVVAFFYFYMVVDAYKTAKAKELGLPLPDLLRLNSIFGIEETAAAGTPVTHAVPAGYSAPNPPPATAAGTAPAQSFAPATGEAQAVVDPVPPAAPAPPPYAPLPAIENRAPGLPIGAVVLIGLGVVFLLGNLGLFQFHWIGRLWPLVLIAIGVWMFACRWRARV